MLEQAGLANVVSSFQTDEVGAVRVFLASWPAAMHCFMAEMEGLGICWLFRWISELFRSTLNVRDICQQNFWGPETFFEIYAPSRIPAELNRQGFEHFKKLALQLRFTV